MMKYAALAGLTAALAISAAAMAQTAGMPSQPATPPNGGVGTGTPTMGSSTAAGQPAPGSAVVRPNPKESPTASNAVQHGADSAARTGQRTIAQCRAMSPSDLRSDPVCGKMMSGQSPR